MTQAEMLRELRQDIRDLHDKIDTHVADQHRAETCFLKQLAEIDKKAGINTQKIALFSGGVAIIASGAVAAAFRMIS